MEEENLTQNTTAPVEEKKGLSIASLVLGIISLVLLCFWYISLPCAILALIFGIIGRKKGGKGMATAGIILSAIALVIVAIILILAAVGFGMMASDPGLLNELSAY